MISDQSAPYGEVYVITCKSTGKQYVGQTIRGVRLRWSEHLSSAKTAPWALSKALKKYGPDGFTIGVLDTATSREDLNSKEIYWIRTLGTFVQGYNLTEGGEGGTPGMPLSAEHRAKISASHKGICPTQETKEKIRNANRGKRRTPEQRAKQSAALKGRPVSPETREKQSAARKGRKLPTEVVEKLKGRVFSSETRAKMSASAKARCPPSKETRAKLSEKGTGRKHTQEQRDRISETLKGRPCTPEKSQRIIEALQRRTPEQESERRSKLSAALQGKPGRKHTPEAKARMSEIHRIRWEKKRQNR